MLQASLGRLFMLQASLGRLFMLQATGSSGSSLSAVTGLLLIVHHEKVSFLRVIVRYPRVP